MRRIEISDNIGSKVRALRKSKKLTQEELARRAQISRSYLCDVERGRHNPSLEMLKSLAGAMEEDIGIFFRNEAEPEEMRRGTMIPVLGRIRAGIPIEAIPYIIDYEPVSNEMIRGGAQYFALQTRGDSMEPILVENDILIIRKQHSCPSGKIAIIMVDGEDATVKKFIKHKNGIELVAINEKYAPIFYTNEEVECLPVRVIGIVEEMRRKL